MIYEGDKSLESSVFPGDMGMEYLSINARGIVLVNVGSKRHRIKKNTNFYEIACDIIVKKNEYRIVEDADRLTVYLTGRKRARTPESAVAAAVDAPPQQRRQVTLTEEFVLDVFSNHKKNYSSTFTSILSLVKDCDVHIQVD